MSRPERFEHPTDRFAEATISFYCFLIFNQVSHPPSSLISRQCQRGTIKSDHKDATVSVLLQEHDPALRGTFQTAVNYETGAWSEEVAVGDLNNDGKPDLAVLNESSVSLLFQSATPGVYLPRYNLDAPPTVGMAIADLNADGLNDLAVAGIAYARVYFQDPAAPGSFQPGVIVSP